MQETEDEQKGRNSLGASTDTPRYKRTCGFAEHGYNMHLSKNIQDAITVVLLSDFTAVYKKNIASGMPTWNKNQDFQLVRLGWWLNIVEIYPLLTFSDNNKQDCQMGSKG